ncbi:MAG: metallophosphoesterase family protein [Balneolaceae bacterium]|nr:metallophosphoesterase family protein [Balneolaceae bacterium]
MDGYRGFLLSPKDDSRSGMIKIGLISDTHNYFDPQIKDFFSDRDEIWHAGDFGTSEIADQLQEIAPVIGVYGNIDGQDIRKRYPLNQRFKREGVDIWITHIGGVPGRYCLPIKEEIENNPPDLFICGHSHILKIARDQSLNKMLYMNPGAAGKQGFQVYRTMIRFAIEKGKIMDVEVINLGKVSEQA